MENVPRVCLIVEIIRPLIQVFFSRYAAPFDRHDWVVDRCGMQMRYVVDFYTGRTDPVTNKVSFYLDVRPALDNWEAVKMRVENFWGKWLGSNTSQS